MSSRVIEAEALNQEAFAEYGEVIETDARDFNVINDGSARNFSDLARIDVLTNGGYPRLNIYESDPLPAPIEIKLMERHPLGSQAFIPLGKEPFLVVVSREKFVEEPRAFITNGSQGINFAPNTWHHPLLVLKPASRFLVIDRGGEGENCEIVNLATPVILQT